MQQDDLSDFISQIANKYENPTFNTNNEDNIISQAENLLLQFGIQPKNTSNKKKSKKVKIEPNQKFVKKQFKPTQNQISTLIIAPNQNSSNSKKQDDEIFPLSLSSNCEVNDQSSDIFDQLMNDEIILNNNNINQPNNKEIQGSQKPTQNKKQKRKKLNEIDINSLNNLLDEIEAEFSVSDKQKHENKRIYKENKTKHKEDNNVSSKKETINNDRVKSETTTVNNNNNSNEAIKNTTKEQDKPQQNSDEDNKDFTNEISQINKIFLNKYFSRLKNKYILRSNYYKLIKFIRKVRLKRYLHLWIEAKRNQQNLPRFKEFDHLKRIEELGDEYQKQIFTRKFLLIWARHYRYRIQKRIEKEIEIRNMNPHLKIVQTMKKQKLVKKPPPPPPIQVDPKYDEMIKQNKEIKDQKLNNVKIQIKQDKIKQQQIQKELIENEKKKRMLHLKGLQKQKIERQNKMKNEEEKIRNQRIFSTLCNKAENHYINKLKIRVLKKWKSFLSMRDENEYQAKYQFKNFIKKLYFNRIKERFYKHENQKMISAVQFNNRLLMKRALIAIKKVKEVRKKKFPIIQKNSAMHLLRNFFNEWKFNKISSRRKKKLKAIEFYESHLIRRIFNAYLAAIKQNKEDEKRKNFKDKLLQKAHQYLNENQQDDEEPLRLTLNSGTLNSQPNLVGNDNDDNEPIKPLTDSLQISLGLLDSNDNLKFENDSDDFF